MTLLVSPGSVSAGGAFTFDDPDGDGLGTLTYTDDSGDPDSTLRPGIVTLGGNLLLRIEDQIERLVIVAGAGARNQGLILRRGCAPKPPRRRPPTCGSGQIS